LGFCWEIAGSRMMQQMEKAMNKKCFFNGGKIMYQMGFRFGYSDYKI